MTSPVTIGYGVNKWLKDSDTKVISLFNNSDFGTKSLFSAETGLVYLTPVGKKCIILSIDFQGDIQTLYYDTVIDTAGTKLFVSVGSQADPKNHPIIPCWLEIPASNYVTATVTGSDAQGTFLAIETTV